MNRKCALLVAALAAAPVAFATLVGPLAQTNTVDGVDVFTYWTYDVDEGSSPGKATIARVADAEGDVTLKNFLVIGDKLYTSYRLDDGAVHSNPALLSCKVPNTILEIGEYAFLNCTSLASVELMYGVREIGARAFVNTAIREITLPDSVIDLGGNIAAGTLFTTSINIGDSSHFVYSEDGVLYNRDKTKLYACPTRAEGTITIPNTLTNIATDAFFGCHRLTYLNIPSTVNTIGAGAFNVSGIWPGLSAPESTPKLKTVFFNGAPPEAPEDIFEGAPEDLTVYAFTKDWSGMDTWKGRKVQVIDSANPPVLSYTDEYGITWSYRIVNDEVEIYGEDASGKPTTAVSPSSTAGVPYKLDEESTLTRKALKIPDAINGYAVTKIGPHAFDGCKALAYVGIPSSVKEIGDSAFKGCASIVAIGGNEDIPFGTEDNTVALPRGVTRLGRRPFEGVQAASFSFPYTLSATDGNPVAGCEYVATITVDGSCPAFTVSGGAMYDKAGEKLVSVPANGSGKTFSFPASMTSIGDEAFAGCRFIKELTIPVTVADIGSAAFTGCDALAKVVYPGDAPAAPDNVYDGTPASLTSYAAAAAAGFTEGTWKDRPIVLSESGAADPDDPDVIGATFDDGSTVWTYDIINGNAIITGADGDSATVTIPKTLGGHVVTDIDCAALDGLTGVRRYASESPLLTAKNGCLYSADGKTLVRVPEELVLPYAVTTEVSSNIVTVTTIPGIKESGNQGNDGTSITTNIQSIAASRYTANVEGDVSFEKLLDGVTGIADHAFYGCNAAMTNEDVSVSESLGGETGFIGAAGDAYIRVVTADSTLVRTFRTSFKVPSTLTFVSDTAFEGSTVEIGAPYVSSGSVPPVISHETTDTLAIEENTAYIGWIEKSGRVAGTFTVKTGKTRNGVVKVSGSAVVVGRKRIRIKSMDDLYALGDVRIVKDLSKSRSVADKAAFNGFKGRRWTIAYKTTAGESPLLGHTTLSLSVAAKGKVLVKGTAADGTKITGTAQMVADGDAFLIPLAIQTHLGRRGGIALCIQVGADGSVSADGTAVLRASSRSGDTEAEVSLVAAAPLAPFSGKAIFVSEDVAKAGYELDASLRGWKPRFTKTSGEVKGSVYLVRKADGRRVRATVSGVAVEGVGYSTISVRNVGGWQALVMTAAVAE